MLQRKKPIDIARATSLACALIVSSSTVMAEQATYLSNKASYCEIFQAINPEVPERCRTELDDNASAGSMTRSIKIHQAQQAVNSAMQGAPTTDDGPREFAMQIRFKFDSSTLTPDAMETLDRVAEVLNSETMREKVIMLEGHTDAIGTDNYNLTLSTQRALAVQFYLTEQHFIAMDRLLVTGKGEAELYDSANPSASLNRRVEFTNLDS